MKVKAVACVSILLVFTVCQQANGSQMTKLFVQSLSNTAAQQTIANLNLEQVSLQAKAKGPNPDCPNLATTLKVYRVTRPDESCVNGLLAKDPTATSTVLYHVRYGSKNVATQYISTTASKKIAETKYWPNVRSGGGLVEIDIGTVIKCCKIIDLNYGDVREKELGTNPFAFNFARKDCEVLLDCGTHRVPCKYLKKKPMKRERSSDDSKELEPPKKKKESKRKRLSKDSKRLSSAKKKQRYPPKKTIQKKRNGISLRSKKIRKNGG